MTMQQTLVKYKDRMIIDDLGERSGNYKSSDPIQLFEISDMIKDDMNSVHSILGDQAVGWMEKKNKKFSARTPSSYVLFSLEHRKIVIDQSPDLSLGEVSKMCGVAWKKLSDEEKTPWQGKAYELNHPAAKILASLDPARAAAISNMLSDQKEN